MLGESPAQRVRLTTSWTWLAAGHYHFGLTLLADQLSVMMMLIVAGVGSLIVAYSVGYMDGEDEERRYFAYMSLFVFSMLLLVQGGNLLLLLAGWGMVGLSSYLLIGFYQERPAAVAAAKKAFVMNAFGDATLALALFLLIEHTGALDYAGRCSHAAPHGGTLANADRARSARRRGREVGADPAPHLAPRRDGRPDAGQRADPRRHDGHRGRLPDRAHAPAVRRTPGRLPDLAAGLGAATLLMAGLIALVQVDIKRVIAYSTMSQIGYMFVGAGIGAYPAAMFHLMTHAFFKALLFLAAGIVIHALGGEQDIRRMGGLGRAMPFTRSAFLIGSLALVGIPPFAGFFSKDSIIAATLTRGAFGYCLFAACLVGAFLTGALHLPALLRRLRGERSGVRDASTSTCRRTGARGRSRWSGRSSVLRPRGDRRRASCSSGDVWHPLTTWLGPVAPRRSPMPAAPQEAVASVAAVALGLAGICGRLRASTAPGASAAPRPLGAPRAQVLLGRALRRALLPARPSSPRGRSRASSSAPLIAGSIGELARGFRIGSGELGRVQNGLVRSYALAIASGVAVLAVVFLSTR